MATPVSLGGVEESSRFSSASPPVGGWGGGTWGGGGLGWSCSSDDSLGELVLRGSTSEDEPRGDEESVFGLPSTVGARDRAPPGKSKSVTSNTTIHQYQVTLTMIWPLQNYTEYSQFVQVVEHELEQNSFSSLIFKLMTRATSKGMHIACKSMIQNSKYMIWNIFVWAVECLNGTVEVNLLYSRLQQGDRVQQN